MYFWFTVLTVTVHFDLRTYASKNLRRVKDTFTIDWFYNEPPPHFFEYDYYKEKTKTTTASNYYLVTPFLRHGNMTAFRGNIIPIEKTTTKRTSTSETITRPRTTTRSQTTTRLTTSQTEYSRSATIHKTAARITPRKSVSPQFPPLFFISHVPEESHKNTFAANQGLAIAKMLILPEDDPVRRQGLEILGNEGLHLDKKLYDWIMKDLQTTSITTKSSRAMMVTELIKNFVPRSNEQDSYYDNINYEYVSDSSQEEQKNPGAINARATVASATVSVDSGNAVFRGAGVVGGASVVDGAGVVGGAGVSGSTRVIKPNNVERLQTTRALPPEKDLENIMTRTGVGYFTGFISTLCKITRKKSKITSQGLVKATAEAVKKRFENGDLNSLGEITKTALKSYLEHNAGTRPILETVALLKDCQIAFESYENLPADIQPIVKGVDLWFKKDHEKNLIRILNVVENYPENQLTSKKVAETILEPFFNLSVIRGSTLELRRDQLIQLLEDAVINQNKEYYYEIKLRAVNEQIQLNKLRKNNAARRAPFIRQIVKNETRKNKSKNINKTTRCKNQNRSLYYCGEDHVNNMADDKLFSTVNRRSLEDDSTSKRPIKYSYNNKDTKIFIHKIYKKLNQLLNTTYRPKNP